MNCPPNSLIHWHHKKHIKTSNRWSILESPYHVKSSRVHSQFLTVKDLLKSRPVRQILVKFLVSNSCCRPRRQPSVNVVKPEELHNGPASKLFLLVTHFKLKWCIKHKRPWFTTSLHTKGRVENMPRGRAFLKNFEVFQMWPDTLFISQQGSKLQVYIYLTLTLNWACCWKAHRTGMNFPSQL